MMVIVSENDFAALFIARHPNFVDFIDAEETNAQTELLRANGLDALNGKVLASPFREVLDVITEHNLAAMLVRSKFSDLRHEPTTMTKPVDFVGMRGGRCHRVEVKRLAASKHDKLHGKVMETANKALVANTEPILIEMWLAEPFRAADINPLTRQVKESLRQPEMDRAYTFRPHGVAVASYRFRPDASARHPRVGILLDSEILRNVTGSDEGRIVEKVKRAYDKFKTCPHDDAVQLLALEVDNFIHLSQVAGALYGQEFVTFTRQGYEGRGRHPGGAFSQGLHSLLGGLVVARRAEKHRLFCGYAFTLFTNPSGTLPVPEVAEALGVEMVLGPTDFP